MIAAKTSVAEMGAFLDQANPSDRWEQLRTLSRAEQRSLYDMAAEAPPLTLADFVPEATAAGSPVRHEGRNTIPLPCASVRFFAKVFARGKDGTVFGYNDSPLGGLIGPGYFVATTTSHEPSWAVRGAVVVDYFQIPQGSVPDGWPSVRPNESGLQYFVYRHTRDFMRRVSAHVTIGAAYKRETKLDHYFVLDRRP